MLGACLFSLLHLLLVIVFNFPASGYRNSGSGVFNNVSTNGYGWSTSSYGSSTIWGAFLNFNSGNVNPLNNTNRGHSFPVRCVQELMRLCIFLLLADLLVGSVAMLIKR